VKFPARQQQHLQSWKDRILGKVQTALEDLKGARADTTDDGAIDVVDTDAEATDADFTDYVACNQC